MPRYLADTSIWGWANSGRRPDIAAKLADVEARSLEWLVSDSELARRRAARPVTEPRAERGYLRLFLESVTQADQGVDFDFLRPVTPSQDGAQSLGPGLRRDDN